MRDLQSWPRLSLVVADCDTSGKLVVLAKGSILVPFKHGFHDILCPLARSSRSRWADMQYLILHVSSQDSEDLTEPSGFVRLRVYVIHRRSLHSSILT